MRVQKQNEEPITAVHRLPAASFNIETSPKRTSNEEGRSKMKLLKSPSRMLKKGVFGDDETNDEEREGVSWSAVALVRHLPVEMLVRARMTRDLPARIGAPKLDFPRARRDSSDV